jgi:haloacetate dehalogenase
MSPIDASSVGLPGAGLQVHGLRAGRVASPLLLLHGWPEGSHAWHPATSRIAHRFERIATELRGRSAFGFVRHAARAVVAQTAAGRAPQRVTALDRAGPGG